MSQVQQDHTDWLEVFQYKGERNTLFLYENVKTGSVDIVQVNDEGESITTHLKHDVVEALLYSLRRATV